MKLKAKVKPSTTYKYISGGGLIITTNFKQEYVRWDGVIYQYAGEVHNETK